MKVLIVDDSKMFQEYMKELLELNGFEYSSAFNPDEFKEKN